MLFYFCFLSLDCLVPIDSIKEVRLGKTTERLREYAHQFQNESLFSIIYTNGNNQYASLDLVASSADEANIWVTGLSCLISGQGTPPSPAGKFICFAIQLKIGSSSFSFFSWVFFFSHGEFLKK